MQNSIRRSVAVGAFVGVSLLAGHPHAQEPTAITLSLPGRASSAASVASHGRFVAVAWGASLDGKWDIYAATSEDEAASFGAPVRVNTAVGDGRVGGEIPPRIALHLPRGASQPEVVVAWNAKDRGTEVKIARSRDFGRSFAAPVSLQAPGAAGDRGWHALTIDAAGTAHVVWLDHRGLASAKAHGHSQGADDGVAMAQNSRLHYATVGAKAAPEQLLAPGVCYCCKTALAPTSRGVLAAWRHVYPGHMRDIAFGWLTEPSTTTGAPPRVSEDGWAINGCPDDGPALAVGANDRVHIVWPTVVPGPEPVGALFYATMTDGSRFGARQRIPTLGAPKPSHPQVAVDGTGRLFFAWDETRDRVRTAAIIDAMPARSGALTFAAPHALAPAARTQYPVLAPLARGVVVAWTSGPPESSVITVRRHRAPATD